MESQQQSSAVVNDLIVINNDRYEGYKTAAAEVKESDLKNLFTDFSNQSKAFAEDLRKHTSATPSAPTRDETKTTGKLYRAWMDVKAAITSKDRKAILSSCEFGEDVAKKHYEEALMHPHGVSSDALEVIRKQSESIKKGHDTIKSLRDSAS
jgi:uncharacterized protein (TIGR02284 family)